MSMVNGEIRETIKTVQLKRSESKEYELNPKEYEKSNYKYYILKNKITLILFY